MIPAAFDRRSLHEAYRAGLDPAQVIEAVFERLATVNDPGIFISLCPRATIDAWVSSLGPFDAETKPLWGLPFAIKDNIDLAGVDTTAACRAYAYRPSASAACIEHLVAAGAVPIGKTNLDQFATGLVGTRTPYPVPHNAFDPTVVPGGSSSGSAIAVAHGIVTFALGTDTAGSGRVPAGLNNLVGLKPSLGAVSVRGVVPACRTLDCVSVFALTVEDAWVVFREMAREDPLDPWSRRFHLGEPSALPSGLRIGIPDAESRRFFGDSEAEAAFERALHDLADLGVPTSTVDLSPFFEAAELLYGGGWVGERYAAVRTFIEASPDAFDPTTRAIIGGAGKLSAADAFDGLYRLQELRRLTRPTWQTIDALIVPTLPTPPTIANIAADPIGPNSRLGTYTNFVNLLDLCALAVPGRFRSDGLPAGVTLIARAGHDALLASIGARLQEAAATPMGATKAQQPSVPKWSSRAMPDEIELVVVGAHLSGMPLNHQLTALAGRYLRSVATTADYRLYALFGNVPRRPGLVRLADGTGVAIDTEVWAMPRERLGDFIGHVAPPLTLGTVRLADGTTPIGFLCESAGIADAQDISGLGGWRRFVQSDAA